MKRGIDHLVLCVRDMEAAAARFERLGFTLTPLARHPFGTGNRLVQLQGEFLEVLTVVSPDQIPAATSTGFSFGAYNRDYLAIREGLSMVALESADWRSDREWFTKTGLDLFDPFEFSRKAERPDGSTLTVGFDLTFIADEAMGEAVFFTCHHRHSPDDFYKAEFQAHGNGAVRITEVVTVAEEPQSVSGLYAGLFGAVSDDGDGLVADAGGARIRVLKPARLAERFPAIDVPSPGDTAHFAAYGIAVTDLGRTRSVLDAGGVPFTNSERGLWVSPDDVFGCGIEFVDASSLASG